MADSENSRTVSSITRGNVMQAAETLLVSAFSPPQLSTDFSNVDVAARWTTWRRFSQQLDESVATQQRLERELLAMPASEMAVVGGTGRTRAKGAGEVDATFRDFCRASRAVATAAHAEEKAARELSKIPALSIAEVIAKTHCALQRGQPSLGSREAPWPEIRAILADLMALVERRPSPDDAGGC
jgi:hypothetical protein